MTHLSSLDLLLESNAKVWWENAIISLYMVDFWNYAKDPIIIHEECYELFLHNLHVGCVKQLF
jgi:hypothetical protein